MAITDTVFSQSAQPVGNTWQRLIGTQDGLFVTEQSGRMTRLWSGGNIKKIIPYNKAGSRWLILTSEGILVSDDLRNWESRNNGLPEMTIKTFENGTSGLGTVLQDIKDLEIDPQNPETMVCAVKDAVYLTRDGGRNWESLGMPNYRSNGTKAVAVTTIGADLTVFYTHSIYGFYYITPGKTGAKWIELNTGIEVLETTENPDEISDIAIYLQPEKDPEILISQSFRKNIYRLNWNRKAFELLWSGGPGFGTADSLSVSGNYLRFVQDNGLAELTIPENGAAGNSALRQRKDLADSLAANARSLNTRINCVVFAQRSTSSSASGRQTAQRINTAEYICLSELWLLSGNAGQKAAAGAGREGIYLPVNHAMDPYSLAPYMELVKSRRLNMVTIDMKDDYGRLRFTPKNTAITNWGRVFRPVDLETFMYTMKEAGIYTVARIVVFKDPEAAAKNNGKYAVWDRVKNIPWEGYYETKQKKNTPPDSSSNNKTEIIQGTDPEWETLRTFYDEKWVDPYAEEFWEYIAAVSEELCQRGFDEIQFDYIRFPTDGINLGDASYRWRNTGMSMDSAIISFLRHVRSRINAPISADIYGANGWYRTGARTGQEVELLTQWVDIICPMYYPSHFEQYFLAQKPPEQRPYRIYNTGVLRTNHIARGNAVIRPWVQAFYLNVSYDRQYYNTNYIQLEISGARDAGTGGFTYWNNLGRYEDVPLP